MKKLTYEQVWDKFKKHYPSKTLVPDYKSIEDENSNGAEEVALMKSIVDSFNESIEHHNTKQFICNECDEWLSHVGVQTDTTVQIYRCDVCGNIVHYDNYNKLLTLPIDNGEK